MIEEEFSSSICLQVFYLQNSLFEIFLEIPEKKSESESFS